MYKAVECSCRRGEGRIVEARGVKDTTRTQPQSELCRPHRSSQKRKWQTPTLYGPELGPLHRPYVVQLGVLVGLPTLGLFLTPLPMLGTLFSYWVAMSSHDMRVCGQSLYLI